MRLLIMIKNMVHDTINIGISATAPLVSDAARITEAGKDETMDNLVEFILVPCKPSDRTNSTGDK